MTRDKSNLAYQIKHTLFEGRFVVFSGMQGAGKTSKGVAELSLDYKYHNKQRLRLAEQTINHWNATSNVKLKLPEHLYYSTIDICLTDPRKKNAPHTHFFDINRLGIPNDDYSVQNVPPYSVIFLCEMDAWFNSHKWQQISAHVTQLVKLVRKNHLTIICDMQVFEYLAKQLRSHATDLFFVRKSEFVPARFFGLIKSRTHWWFYHINPQELEFASSLERSGITIPRNEQPRICRKLTYKGNVYRQYDSYAERLYFYYRIEEEGYQILEHPKNILSPDGVKEYCQKMPLPSDNNADTAE